MATNLDEVRNRIKNRRKELGLSYADLSRSTGLAKSTLHRYESGDICNLGLDKVDVLAKALDTSAEYLMGWAKNPDNSIRINVYGVVPAGIPIEEIDDIRGWEEIPREWTRGGKECIALVVQGDSMYPKYMDGDVVIVELQADFESGADCIVFLNGSNAMIRRVLKNSEDSIILEPFNRIYAPTRLNSSKESVSILGIVKELRRKIL